VPDPPGPPTMGPRIVIDDTDTGVVFLHYPPTGVLVRGDPWLLPVEIRVNGQPVDVTTWTWRSQIRRHPDANLLDAYTITSGHTPPGTTVPSEVHLYLGPDSTRHIPNGAVMDLEQLTPETRTWWAATLRVTPDVSH
jgi:hypothetical protein